MHGGMWPLVGIRIPIIKTHRQIALKGEGLPYQMVQKALLRNGVEASEKIVSPCWVEVHHAQSFVLHLASGNSFAVQSIEALLHLVRKHALGVGE